MKIRGFNCIGADKLENLEMLQNNVLYSDDIYEMAKAQQKEIYDYCKLHANYEACRENLKQIRYAVTRVYFGY